MIEPLYLKKNPTIDDVKPHDRQEGYPLHVPVWYTRIFETIPGTITWLFLLMPFITALLGYEDLMILYISFLTLYWTYRSFRFVYGIFIGYMRMKRDIAIDWMAKMKDENLPHEKVKYVYIFPIVNEGLETLEPAMDAWKNLDINTKNMSIVFALEQRFEQSSKERTEHLKKKYGKHFREMITYVHPNDIDGEVEGVKTANINWASRCFVDMITLRGEKLEEFLLITCDSDLRPHPKYLSAITYKFLTDPSPYRKFYSTAVHTFNNNVYRVPSLVRIFSHFLTLVMIHEWVLRKKIKETWSSYVVSLKTVAEGHFWDPTIPNDDTAFYFNALIRFAGDFAGEEVYIPTYNDAVENQTYVKTHTSLYKQQLRWGWGSIVFPMTFAGLYQNPNIPFKKKLQIALPMFDDRLLFRTAVYLITFGMPILTLIHPAFKYSSVSYTLPQIMSGILTAVVFLNIPIYLIKLKLSPQPRNWSLFNRVLDFFETFLITINLLTFAFIPYLQAWTEMMLGKKPKKHYATEKIAIKT